MSDARIERHSAAGPVEILPPQSDSEGENDQGWADVVLENLKRRNNSQVEPFSAIYQSNTKLWYEHARLQSLLKDVKHQFAIVQHETADLFSSSCSDGSSTAVDKLKLKLSQIQIELRERGNLESSERKAKIDLSKKVRDQAKLIADQSEELKMAKGELSSAHETNTFLTEEIKLERNSGILVKDEIENIRKLFHNLEKENAQLIERILLEKGKTAQAMNDMMKGAKDFHNYEPSESDRTVSSGGDSSVSKERSRSASDFISYPITESKKPLEMKSISSLQCHKSEINDVCVSTNGQYFATAGSDGTVKTYEMATTRHLLDLKTSNPIICIDISSDQHQGGANQWIACGGSDGTCKVWNLQTGSMKLQVTGHSNKVHCCKFLGNNRLLTCSADRSIKLWEFSRSRAEIFCWMKTKSSALSVTASPDHNTLVSGHQDGGVRFWDPARSTQCVHHIEKLHTSHVTFLQYCPRNSYEVMTLSKDNTLSILDTRNYLCSQIFKASTFRVTYDWSRASYSPDGRYVGAGSADGGVYIWNVQDPDMCTILTGSPKAGPISSIAWSSPQGEIVAADKQGRCTIWK